MRDANAVRRVIARPLLRKSWPLAALVLVAAAGWAAAQRGPRWASPILAAAGGALVVALFVRALARLYRRRPGDGLQPLWPVVVNVVALVVVVVLPLTHVIRAIIPPRDGTPRIHTGFGDWSGSEGYPLFRRHRGLDVAGRLGDDVLAAADGRVTVARDNGYPCGLIVVIDHEYDSLRTVYCHFSAIAVRVGDTVRRGDRIGAVGISGQRASPGFEHVHLELQRGRDVNAIEDPLPRVVGCFDPRVAYPTDRLVLTYPVRCHRPT
jgi:murein DD-endopeptidase MepM/ murein hydrolase activator NlpD